MRRATRTALLITAGTCVTGVGLLIWQNRFNIFLCIASLDHDEPGAFIEVSQISAKLKQVNTTNELQGWLQREIISAQQTSSNLEVPIPLHNFPSWVTNIYGCIPPPGGAQLMMDGKGDNSHVELRWTSGRGMLGTHIGPERYEVHLNTVTSLS